MNLEALGFIRDPDLPRKFLKEQAANQLGGRGRKDALSKRLEQLERVLHGGGGGVGASQSSAMAQEVPAASGSGGESVQATAAATAAVSSELTAAAAAAAAAAAVSKLEMTISAEVSKQLDSRKIRKAIDKVAAHSTVKVSLIASLYRFRNAWNKVAY